MANTKHFDCMPSDMTSLERVHYFARMLITPDDMTAEQEYFRNKLRRHNRLIHGWGVVCGCEVTPGTNQYEVKISQGYILGPYGDEIIIPKELTFDIQTELICGCTTEPTNGSFPIDPWCSDVKRTIKKSGQTYYIAVKHKEIETRPVRAHPVGCSCEQAPCESSRIMDCFLVKALETLPASHDPSAEGYRMPIQDPREIVSGEIENCLQCPTDPWVVLADVTVSENNMIGEYNIDNCCHRRWVISVGKLWWKCRGRPSIRSISPNEGIQGESLEGVTITGCNFFLGPEDGFQVDFGDENIKVYITFRSHTKLIVNLDLSDATTGFKDVTVTNPDGQSHTLSKGFTVKEPSEMALVPGISKILPTKSEPGKTEKVSIRGSNFQKGVTLDFGPGISVADTTFKSANELIVTLKVDPSAEPGPRVISITNPEGPEKKFKNMFAVLPAKKIVDPIIEEIDSPTLRPGEEKVIVIKGKNFDEKASVSFGASAKSRISLKEIESITENEIRVKIKVWANAWVGPRDLTVTNPGRPPVSKSGLFKIEREG